MTHKKFLCWGIQRIQNGIKLFLSWYQYTNMDSMAKCYANCFDFFNFIKMALNGPETTVKPGKLLAWLSWQV